MDSVLPIGTKHGCYTIIGGFEVYQEKVAKQKIADLEQKKQRFINGEKISGINFNSVDVYDRTIQNWKSYKKYQCQCRCGKVKYLLETYFSGKGYRYCGDDCGKKQESERKRIASYPRVKDESYDIDYSNTTHESLEVLECIDENYEGKPIISHRGRRGKEGGKCKVYKLYRCRCYLCGTEYQFKSSDFKIKNDDHGSRAKDGYYCDAYCDCHKISSFQWRTIKILRDHNVAYRVEVEFQDLYGIGQKNLLRYDFAVLGSDNSIKCLIECQGEQHYKPVDEFGGVSQYESQAENDKLKRAYAESHNIPLFEIKYTCNTYEKEIKVLKTAGII
ncbi:MULTISPECIES: hypothetical protein [Bacillus cereus group]|uniref:hypothetical protein n=1 Tax=Bacillus cereus group TaxID=86661 RepID=UPI000BEC68F7|nr:MULTISPECIES: hypothetical protein [Bacillus cereus group]MBJ7933402.1 hypothetical protein [Bacillus cereus group sp. N31]PEG12595.1 hypothetical protein COO04_30070 [Bacillus toyonensis]PHF98539.1 hypothetical protein COI66_31675 [Bacillus toyonensis]QWH92297.1 hypothetical protein EXW29_29845 [Bacillus toyonensis]QWI35487.1 hypothetical protein EXW25_29825 [Bacillus toyonensis]